MRTSATGPLRLPTLLFGAILLGVIFLPGPLRAQTFPPGSVSLAVLPNGLRVIFKQTPGSPLVAVSLWVKAGSRNETAGNNGAAHMLEHYLFQGRSTGPSGVFDRQIEGMGGTLNAETARDDTHFYAVLPRESYGPALKVIAEMIQHPAFDPAQLETERRRDLDEVQQHDDDPVTFAQQALYQQAYAISPYRFPAAGTTDSIKHLTLDAIRSFYNTYYHPENASLVVVGDLSREQAQAAAQAAWGTWPRSQTLLPAVPQEPERTAAAPAHLIPRGARTERALVMMGFPAPSAQDARSSVIMDVIYTMVTSGQRSLMAQQIGKTGLLVDYGSDFITSRDPGLFLIWGFAPVGDVKNARQKITELVNSIGAGAFSDHDLARARQSLLGSYALDNETVGDQATGLGFYDAIASFEYAVQYESVVQSVTREDLIRVARNYFRTSSSVVLGPAGTAI